jgi:hypothetical protein
LPCGNLHGVSADESARNHLTLGIQDFESRTQRFGQRLVEACGILGIEEGAAAGIGPAAEGRGELLIVEREADDAHTRADAGLAKALDGRRRIAAAGFLTIGDQHDELSRR